MKTDPENLRKDKDCNKPLDDEKLAGVIGGLGGAYADVTLQNPDESQQAEELENAKEKSGCGK